MTTEQIENLRSEISDLETELKNLVTSAEAEERDLSEDEARMFDEWKTDRDNLKERLARAEEVTAFPAVEKRVVLPAAQAKGSTKVEQVYRPDQADISFFRDVVAHSRGDFAATERLTRHQQIAQETRDVTIAGGLAGFNPPIYMGSDYADFPRESRPFADIAPKAPFPPAGTSITVPRVTTATAVAVQAAEADAVQETNIDDTLLTVGMATIAGMQDVSIQALERTFPGADQIIFDDLRADYDEQLDTQCLSGTGSNGQHLGIRAVTSINTTQYTDASPTTAEFTPKVYDALQEILSNRHAPATHIVMHPRRAAWLASNLSSSFPLFQQGQLNQASGTQDQGFLQTFAGLRVVLDSNIGTTYSDGGNTNEDEVYVVRAGDLRLMEGPLQVRVETGVLSGTLQVRLLVYAYSFFVSGRYPSGISRIYGSGLAAPTF